MADGTPINPAKPPRKSPVKSDAGTAAAPSARRAAPLKAAPVDSAPLGGTAPQPAEARPKRSQAASLLKEKATEATKVVRKEAVALKDQATGRARTAATEGKARATTALDNVAKLIGDAAGAIDDKVGTQYGDYTRKAADAVSSFATDLKGKEVDEIVRDATEFVKKSPALAIGAAAAVGFVIARLVKAGGEDDSSNGQA